MSGTLQKNFTNELNQFLKKNIVLTKVDGDVIHGVLLGLRTEDLSVILGDAEDGKEKHPRMFISGKSISTIVVGEAPFDIDGLRIELEKVFKKSGVRFFSESRTLMVMDRFKVTEQGVEGEGPVADRIKRIWQDFVR